MEMSGDSDKNKKMKNRFFIFCGLALSMTCAYADGEDYKKPVVEDVDFFPKFESLKPPILMPQNAEIKISDDGHFLVNGKPRYLEGTLFYEGDSLSVDVPTYGYPPSLKWLYETTQNYEDLQRLGFDTVGTGIPNDWMQKYRKRFIHLRANEKMFLRYAQSGLPLYVDFTAAEWSHGGLKYVEGMEPSKEAFTVRGSSYHWMPYSANTKEGRQLWREMWESGVQYLKKYSIKPFIYELFNEPIYDDLSDFNKRKFAKEMEVKYGGKIDRLNKEWGTSYADFAEIAGFKKYDENVGLFIEWIKFMEDSFADLCKYGAKIIRAAGCSNLLPADILGRKQRQYLQDEQKPECRMHVHRRRGFLPGALFEGDIRRQADFRRRDVHGAHPRIFPRQDSDAVHARLERFVPFQMEPQAKRSRVEASEWRGKAGGNIPVHGVESVRGKSARFPRSDGR